MSDRMRPIPFKEMLEWILVEYRHDRSIFGIPEDKFYCQTDGRRYHIFGASLGTPVGPAAGPHTQLAQNIVAAYLAGGRFFELKTVQILDSLEFPKPCIAAPDEGYNTEWSTELSIAEAFEEYVKAWLILHVLQAEVFNGGQRDFVFNMSVGYDLDGIRSPKVNAFIDDLKDAGSTAVFADCASVLRGEAGRFPGIGRQDIDTISPHICNSVTLSTMHGCPPADIEAICRHLLQEKKLYTLVKLNPTLLGYEFVRSTLDRMGYCNVQLREESFSHDLQYADGVAMIGRLKALAGSLGKEFGVKLSNTLPVKITDGQLPGEEMYMSGRPVYPLTINLAYRLAAEFAGDLQISYSGGADFFNLDKILATGIRPITMATTLLKPGGYARLHQIAVTLASQSGAVSGDDAGNDAGRQIDLGRLGALAAGACEDGNYIKEKRRAPSRKINGSLPLLDCFVAPCTRGCPIGQDIPEYIRLVGEHKYEQALATIADKNPLPFITGTICNHNCTTRCTRSDYDEPVLIRGLKLVAAEKGYQDFLRNLRPAESADSDRVAVIGAGPSGLAAGYFLARAGIGVTVFDKHCEAGGAVAQVIPDFRISREAVDRDLELIRRMGVKFKLGIEEQLTIQSLRAKGFGYIYVAIGAGTPGLLEVAGDAGRIIGAVTFLENYKKSQGAVVLGRNVVVIGAGNTAMDAARAALRVKGVEKVRIVYRRTREYMPALSEELDLALQEGALLKELLAPVELRNGVLRCQKMALGDPDASGRRRPVSITGEYEEIPADLVVSAVGEMVDKDCLRQIGLQYDARGMIRVDPGTLETDMKDVFIGGDALAGPATVVEAIADGRKVADAIIARESAENGALGAPAAGVALDVMQGGADVHGRKGMLRNAGALEDEPVRCLGCGWECNICAEVCPNRANVVIRVAEGLRNGNQILHLDGPCNACGNCATFCPYPGAPYADKFTLFWSEDDFNNSANDGFLLVKDGPEPAFKVRLAGQVCLTGLTAAGAGAAAVPESLSALMRAVWQQHRYLFPAGNPSVGLSKRGG